MATIDTDRLGLKMQELGDNIGDWHTDLNAGFVAADDRFFQSGAGTPAALTADYIGQKYFDTTNAVCYIATDVDVPSTWVSAWGKGLLQANLIWTSDTEVSLTTALDTVIRVEIDGVIVLHSGALVFDVTAEHMSDPMGASEAVYFYVENVDGVLTPHEDDTAPDPPGGSKPGYHPTSTTYRCVGSAWSDDGTDVQKFYMGRDGMHRFVNHTADQEYDGIAEAASEDWQNLDLAIPETALSVQCSAKSRMQLAGAVVYGAAGATGTLTAAAITITDAGYEDALVMCHSGQNNEVESLDGQFVLPIVDPSSPAISYGVNRALTAGSHELIITGYEDMWAPRGF